jgi:hypothetical protein
VNEKITASIIFESLSNPLTNLMEEKIMKKTNPTYDLLNAEISRVFDFTANVKIGKQGGGGANI